MYSWYQPASCYLDGASRRANQRWRPIYGDRVGSLRTTPFYRQQITIARSPYSGTAEPVYYLLSCTCSHQTVAPICLLCRLISVDCLPSWTFFEDVCFIRDISAWQTDNCLLTYLLTYSYSSSLSSPSEQYTTVWCLPNTQTLSLVNELLAAFFILSQSSAVG